jgi:hypothetical protein
MSELTPVQLLDQARRMLDEPSAGTVSAWSRGSALLARQALEAALCEYWRQHAPGVERASMRAQLLCLHEYDADIGLAADVTFVWNALSHATHHHPYELDPTREELHELLVVTSRLVEQVKRQRPQAAG